jgi:hypothetical protein
MGHFPQHHADGCAGLWSGAAGLLRPPNRCDWRGTLAAGLPSCAIIMAGRTASAA